MPFILHAQCCSTVPPLSSSISCPKYIHYPLAQLLLLPAWVSLPAALRVTQMTLAVTDVVSASPCMGGGALLGLIFINASQVLSRMVSFGQFWLCPFPCFPAELSCLFFFPGSSCHLHQEVNLFFFPISAFITRKWLL